MSTSSNNGEDQKKKRSLRYFHAEAAGQATSEAGNAYQAASLVAAGAGASGVAILSTFTYLVTALLCVKVPSLIGMIGSRKKAIVIMSFFDAVGWVPLVAILMFVRPVNPIWLIPLWVINLVPGMLVYAARNSWLADLVPNATRGKYLGLRSAISGAVYLGTFYVMGYVLNMFAGSTLTGFAAIFLIAFVASFICFFIYSRIYDPVGLPEKMSDITFFGFLRETRSRNLGRFILYVSLFHFAVYISSPLIAVHLLKDLHLSYLVFALVTSSEMIAKILIVTFWGRYSDKVGNLKILGKVSLMIPLTPIFWAISPLLGSNVWYLVIIQLFSGAAWAGFDLCTYNFVYEAAPVEKRLKYIAYHKALTTLGMALGAITGMYLLTMVAPLFGYKILALFMISGILRLIVVMVMFPQLREVRGTMAASVGSGKGKASARPPVLVPGLFHRARQMAYASEHIAGERAGAAEVGDSAITGRGLYHQRGRQYQFAQGVSPAMAEAIGDEHVDLITRGLYYRPKEWAQFGRPLVPELVSCEAADLSQTAKRGLLYRSARERNQLLKSLAQHITTIEAQGEAKVGGSRGIFYRQHEPARGCATCSNDVAEKPKSQLMKKPGLFERRHDHVKGNKSAEAKTSVPMVGRLQPETVSI